MCALNHFKKTRAVVRYMQYTADGSRNYSVMFACVPLSGLLDNDCACNCERSDERESDEAAVGSRLGSAALGFVSGLGFLCGSGGVVNDIAACRNDLNLRDHAPWGVFIKIFHLHVTCGDKTLFLSVSPAIFGFGVKEKIAEFGSVFSVVRIVCT